MVRTGRLMAFASRGPAFRIDNFNDSRRAATFV